MGRPHGNGAGYGEGSSRRYGRTRVGAHLVARLRLRVAGRGTPDASDARGQRMDASERDEGGLGQQPGADVGDDGDIPEDPLLAQPGAGSADTGTGESVVRIPDDEIE